MTQLAICVLAAAEDEDWLAAEQIIVRTPGKANPFEITPLLEDLFMRDSSQWFHSHPSELRIAEIRTILSHTQHEERQRKLDDIQEILEGGVTAFVVLQGPKCNSAGFSAILQAIIEHTSTQDLPLALLKLTRNAPSLQVNIPEAEFCQFFPYGPAADEQRSYERTNLRGHFLEAVRFLYDRTQKRPHVGVGVLLLDKAGDFLLIQRKKFPGKGSYGTFGGVLRMDECIDHALYRYAHDEIGLGNDAFTICDLLSCTNMRAARLHYVDLTFLAVTTDHHPTIQIRNPDTHQKINDADSHWFDVERVIRYYRDVKLFTPVACAFERFCRVCVSSAATRFVHVRNTDTPPKGCLPELYGGLDCLSAFPDLNKVCNHLRDSPPVEKPIFPPLFFESEQAHETTRLQT